MRSVHLRADLRAERKADSIFDESDAVLPLCYWHCALARVSGPSFSSLMTRANEKHAHIDCSAIVSAGCELSDLHINATASAECLVPVLRLWV